VTLTKDTPVPEAKNTHPDDPQKTGSGSSKSPGGGSAPQQTAEEMTAGQESYPGGREGGESDKPA
jgi:hypothetical protein